MSDTNNNEHNNKDDMCSYIEENIDYDSILEEMDSIEALKEDDSAMSAIDEILEKNIASVHDTHSNIISDAINDIIESENNGDDTMEYCPTELAHISVLEKDMEAAYTEYKKILESDENNIEAIYFMGSYYKSYGNKEAALALFEKIVDFGIVNTGVYENLALLDNDKSREYFLKAIKIYNSIDINYYHLKRILYITLDRYKNKDYEICYQYCKLAIMISQSIFLYNLMGCICYHMQYYDEALSSFYNAITKESKSNYVVLCNIAYCYKQKGSIKLAIYYFFKAIKLSDNHDAKLFFALGDAYYISNNFVYATHCFKKAIDIDKDYEDAKKMLEKIGDVKYNEE